MNMLHHIISKEGDPSKNLNLQIRFCSLPFLIKQTFLISQGQFIKLDKIHKKM